MNSKAKRLLSWLCVLALCMSLLPMTALAVPGDGNTSSLTPADRYYTLNGGDTTKEQADITLSKTAVDNGDGTYTVTLSATADRVVTAKPTEVVFVIDGSGSMNWCEQRATQDDDAGYVGGGKDHYHSYDNYGVPYCNLVRWSDKDSRWDIALGAIETMMDNLGEEGISYKFVVYKDDNHDNAREVDSFSDLQSIKPSGGTYLSAGVKEAVDAFKMDNANQVMIIVADGDSGDGYPTQRAFQFKKKGGDIYTVGFTFSSNEFNNLSNGPGYYFTANDADQLKLSMEQISENIKGLISDPLGQNVELVGDVKVAVSDDQTAEGWCWVTNERTINWTCAEGLNGTVTLTYTVKLKDSEKKAGEYSVALNDQATLNYRYRYNSGGDNYYSNSVNFPEPVAAVKAATLDIQVKDGSSTSAIGAQQWLKLDSNNAFDLKDIPDVGEPYGDGKWVESVTVTAKNGNKDIENVTIDDLNDPDPYAYTVTITLTDEEPGPVLDPQATPINVRVMVDGEEMGAGANVGTYVTVSPDQAKQPASWDEASQGPWDPGTFHEDNDTVTYDVTYYDCKDISFTAVSGYVIEAVEADLVYGQNGCNGITNGNGTVTADNVQGGSTVTVYVRTLYSVEYYLDGEKQTEATYNDTTKYVTGTTVLEGDIPSVPTPSDGRDAEGYYPVDCNCKEEGKECKHTGYTDVNGAQTPSDARLVIQQDSTITLPSLPTKANYTVDGWWLNSEGTGNQYATGTDYTVNADEAENNIIKFYAKSTANTADYTVEYVFLDKNGDPINDTGDWTSDVNTFPQSGSATIGETVNLTSDLPQKTTGEDGNNYVLVDGNYSCEITAEGPNNITVTYALDNWKDSEDGDTETGGDEIPDYQQALIKYVVADGQDNGSVSPTLQVETLDKQKNGSYSKDVTANSTATVEKGYAFDYWTEPDNETSWNAILSDTFTAQGGQTYTYTANFAEDKNGDGTPDKYQVFVNFVSANEEQGTVSDKDGAATNTGITQVYTFGNHATSGDVTPSLDGVVVEANEGFAFDIWTKDKKATETDTGVNPAETLKNIQGGTTITFYANFAEDKIGGEEGGGDGTPDKYQATVTYKIVGGTWSSGGNSDIQEVFTLKRKDSTTGQWVAADPPPRLGNTIPTDMTPDATHVTPGNWNTSINDVTAVTGNITYTYTFTTANPAISITKTASVNGEELQKGDTVDVGDTITYTLKVENTGNTDLTAVTVRDTMWGEGNVETIHVDGVPYDLSVKGGYWNAVMKNGPYGTVDKLEPDGTWTCTYTYTVQDGDTTIENTATVSTTEDGPGGDDTITIPVTGYDLSIDKVLTSVNGEPYQEDSKVRPGDVLTYTLTVTNKGDDPLENITVTDSLWGNGVSQIQVGAATIQLPENEDPTTYTISGPLVKDGEPWVCTYTYTVPQDATSVVNTATVDIPGDNDPDDTVKVEVEPDAPGLKVEKSLSQVNGSDYTSGKVSVGDKLTYTIQVTNTGNTTLSGVTVEDSLWNYEDAIQVDGELAYVADGGTYTIKRDIAPSETVTITYTYIVLRSDAGDTLTNTATVTTPDGGPTGEDTTETPVKPVTPIRPPVDPDKPELNTEDHYAYIVGYEDGTVRPENNITRAEVATIFFRLLTDESRDEFWSQTNPYSDVSADDWYNNAVSTLTNAGILDGYEDGTFRPNGNITRAEFATITSRFFEATYEGEDLFPDIDGHWAKDYINESANAGIVNGYEDGTFRPQKLITRAEAMTMVNRTIDRHPDADHLLDDMIVWPDNPETAWYYEQVQEATNSHEYTMNTDDEQNPYEIWTELLPNRDWSELEKEWSDANDGAGSGEVV